MTTAFTLFNSARMLAHLPTAWAPYSSGDSSQHSLETWCTWLGANAKMAFRQHEWNGRRLNKAVVKMGKAVMRLLTVLVIVAFRL